MKLQAKNVILQIEKSGERKQIISKLQKNYSIEKQYFEDFFL